MRQREFIKSSGCAAAAWPLAAHAKQPLRRLALAACLVLLASHRAAALEPVSLQVRWKLEFKLSEYYDAVEEGFRRPEGLEGAKNESGPEIEVAEEVGGGKGEFVVGAGGVLGDRGGGRRLVVLAAMYQHSAA